MGGDLMSNHDEIRKGELEPRRAVKTMLRESFVPVLGVFGFLWGALAILHYLAEARSREPAVIRIAAEPAPLPRGQAGREAQRAQPSRGVASVQEVFGADAGGIVDGPDARALQDESDFAALQAGTAPAGDLRRAMEMASRDSVDAALAAISVLLQANPHRGGAWFARGKILSRKGDREGAVAAFARCAELSAGRAKAVPLYNLGCLHRDAGRTSDAMAAFRRALEERPDYREARLNLAILVGGQPGGRDEARRLYDQLIRLAPDYAPAWYNRGVLAMGDGRTDSARADFARTVEIDSSFAKAWFNLGLLHSRTDHASDAAAAYERAVKADPAHLRARLNLGVSLIRIDRCADAVQVYRELLARDPTFASAWYNLGIAFSRSGDARAAERAYRRVLELEPENAQAWQNLGVLYARRKRGDDAIRCYQEALALAPGNQAARYNLALEYRRRGDYEVAIAEAVRLLKLNPKHAKARQFLATTHARLRGLQTPEGEEPDGIGKTTALERTDS